MKLLITMLIFSTLTISCSSSRLVDQYINPERPNFQAAKVLVVGLSVDQDLQRQFEYNLATALKDENLDAVQSVDYFKENIHQIEQTEENLDSLRLRLMHDGFDAVLFTKVTGQENKVNIGQSYRNIAKSFQTFNEYYKENSPVYNSTQPENYSVYNTETSLYCLCPEKKRDLIWRAQIDVVDPEGITSTIRNYVKTLINSLKRNNVLILD